MGKADRPLIVLTRPAGRNEAIAARLRDQGLRVAVWPALALAVCDAPVPDVSGHDLVVFVSRQAVDAYFSRTRQSWPDGLHAATVGQASAQALRAYLPDEWIIAPSGQSAQDSEALMARLDTLGRAWTRVLILRGARGREWLAQALERRGAAVTRHALYDRTPVQWPCAQVQSLRSGACVVLLTSIEGLESIEQSLHGCGESWPDTASFVVIHPRIAQYLQSTLQAAGRADAPSVKICAPDEEAIFQAILAASR
ncbi:MAG: uroporphyrinogen-III synthase [Alcaligenaceae bacterium]|nr:uroporphyrinogen-III synthase [Alcaligenaceae bacterium]